jgi:hypothetical protein
MAAHGLTENHARGLLASVQYAAQLIRQCEEILAASDRPGPLSRYTGRLPPPARIGAVHALNNAMMFVENESRGRANRPRASIHPSFRTRPKARPRLRRRSPRERQAVSLGGRPDDENRARRMPHD